MFLRVRRLFFAFIASILTLPQPVFAVQVCVKNAAEFAEKKELFPKALHKLPKEAALFASKDWKAAASIKIHFTESGLKLDANVVPAFGSPYFDSCFIKSVCFEDGVLTVNTKNNESFEVKVKSEKSLYYKAMTFTALTPEELVTWAQEVTKGNTEKVTSQSGANQNGGAH